MSPSFKVFGLFLLIGLRPGLQRVCFRGESKNDRGRDHGHPEVCYEALHTVCQQKKQGDKAFLLEKQPYLLKSKSGIDSGF